MAFMIPAMFAMGGSAYVVNEVSNTMDDLSKIDPKKWISHNVNSLIGNSEIRVLEHKLSTLNQKMDHLDLMYGREEITYDVYMEEKLKLRQQIRDTYSEIRRSRRKTMD